MPITKSSFARALATTISLSNPPSPVISELCSRKRGKADGILRYSDRVLKDQTIKKANPFGLAFLIIIKHELL